MQTFFGFLIACLAAVSHGNLYLHKDAPVGKFPYQVSLNYCGKYHGCSGSILNNRNILTTANCVAGLKNELDKLKAHVGTNFLNESGDVYDIESVSIHEDYDPSRQYDNDIALVHLKTPIKYNKLVQPINIMTSDWNIEGEWYTLSGWKTKPDHTDTPFNNLTEVEFMVYTLGSCEDARSLGLICALTAEEEGAYHFSSGSPLVAKFPKIQIGILTLNVKPDVTLPASYPHFKVFTRVSYFAAWITAHLKN